MANYAIPGAIHGPVGVMEEKKERNNLHRDRLFFAPLCDTLSETGRPFLAEIVIVELDPLDGASGLDTIRTYEAERHVLKLELERKL